MGKYKIYHIPDYVYECGSVGKIGTTSQRVEVRMRANKKKSLKLFDFWEILEEHDCEETASRRELELQKQYGYKVDYNPYSVFMKNRNTKGGFDNEARAQLKAKYWGTERHKQNSSKVGKVNHKYLRTTRKCEKCGKETDCGNYVQKHGDNCREHIYYKVIELYQSGKMSMRQACTKYSVDRNSVRKRMRGEL
jgi:hypothetical protein